MCSYKGCLSLSLPHPFFLFHSFVQVFWLSWWFGILNLGMRLLLTEAYTEFWDFWPFFPQHIIHLFFYLPTYSLHFVSFCARDLVLEITPSRCFCQLSFICYGGIIGIISLLVCIWDQKLVFGGVSLRFPKVVLHKFSLQLTQSQSSHSDLIIVEEIIKTDIMSLIYFNMHWPVSFLTVVFSG